MINKFSRLSGISVDDLLSAKRNQDIADARHALHYILVKEKGYSLKRAGQVTCRDHSTVSYSVKRISEMLINTDKPDARLADIWNKVSPVLSFKRESVRTWKVK